MTRIEAVLQALRLEVRRRRGKRVWLLCPWHEDHAPTNFYVITSGRTAGLHFCFSCHKGGSLADLVMRVRGCDYESAKAFIALLGKGYEPPKAKVRVVSRPVHIGRFRFQMPDEILYEPLDQWVTSARNEANRRRLTQAEIDKFKIGYAVDGRLAGRIVLPWLDKNGIPAGYSARTFVDDEPKYLTPHESENADLGVMFGEHLWDRKDLVVVTEGAFNAIAVLRAVDNVDVAALGGSKLNTTQVIKFGTFKRMIVLTDPDPAGDDAAFQLRLFLGKNLPMVRLDLPEGKDAMDVKTSYLRGRLLQAIEDVTKLQSVS